MTRSPVNVVVGVDAGGTSTRCAVATLDGRLLARGRAGGANQFSSADPALALRRALEEALTGAGDTTVSGAVIGIAGASGAGHDTASAMVLRAWEAMRLPGTPAVSDDIAVAFASGSVAAEGSVLIAGTGAVAAHVRDGAVVRRCDGYGWLLGDEGSAVWIALRSLRAVLAEIDGRGPPTQLRDRLARALDIPAGDPQRIIRAVHDRPPADLGALAPEVAAAAVGESGCADRVAREVVADAAERLLTNLATVAPTPVGALPVVLAGSVATEGPVADRVGAGLRERHGVTARVATDGELGAAGLALRSVGAPAEAHTALLEAGRAAAP